VRWDYIDLDAMLPSDHLARVVWRFVTSLDLTELHAAIESRESEAGRPAADPAVVLALSVVWMAHPVAAATLYLHDHIGYLADATTNPLFRRRGLQSALLRRRIRDAAASGAHIVFSGAAPLSTSHRNMERAGMRMHFV
jgi:ribosomal protein S18 acetylase RimI-like enzyme